MSTANRATILGKIHKVLKKHYQPVNISSTRTVLEHLLFSAILENADFETAEETFAKLQEGFFDWNEVRVTTITELAEVMAAIPDATFSAQRVKKLLQAVFETHYQYDLEALKKQNLGKSITDIEKFPGISPFMIAYITQNALAGHAIALGKGAWDVLVAAGAANEQEVASQHLSGLERAIQKNKGVEFFTLLHQCGVDLAASPQSTRVKGILAEIDPDSKERLVAWNSKKSELAAAADRKEAAANARRAARLENPPPPTPPAKSAKAKAAEEQKKKGAKGASEVKPIVAEKAPAEKASEKHSTDKGKSSEKEKSSKGTLATPPASKVDKSAKEKPAKAKPAAEKTESHKSDKDKHAADKHAADKRAKGGKEKESPAAKESSHRLTKRKPK